MDDGYKTYLVMLKFLQDLQGDYWVVEGAKDQFLSPLELRVHQTLIEEFGFEARQLIWKTPATTFVPNVERYPLLDRRTLMTDVVLLGVVDKPVEGEVRHIVLSADASSDIERLIRRERLPFTRLPLSLTADSSQADFKRALFGIVSTESRRSWDGKIINTVQDKTREALAKELDQQNFLKIFRDFTFDLSRKLLVARYLQSKIEDEKVPTEKLADAKKRIEKEKGKFEEENPDYFVYRVFPAVALREIVELREDRELREVFGLGPLSKGAEGNLVLKAMKNTRVSFLVTGASTKPCFVVDYVPGNKNSEAQVEQNTIVDEILKSAKIPIVRISDETTDQGDDRAEQVSFRLIVSLLFELHRRTLLCDEEIQSYRDNRPEKQSEAEQEEHEGMADIWLDWFKEENRLFDFTDEISDKAYKEWKAIKKIDEKVDSKVKRFDDAGRIELHATLPSRKKRQKKFTYQRPLVQLAGNWEKFPGVSQRAMTRLLVLSMFMELRSQVEDDLSKGFFGAQ